jgi:hypothetical protein
MGPNPKSQNPKFKLHGTKAQPNLQTRNPKPNIETPGSAESEKTGSVWEMLKINEGVFAALYFEYFDWALNQCLVVLLWWE